ncbi:MAG: RNA polymerase sigma factor [Actinomycetota bacterium]
METTVDPSGDELELIASLCKGDETAFMSLVERLQPMMLRVARMYVSSQAVAEEVVQEAWLGVLQGIDRFEGRSSLRTWILRIVSNIAKTKGRREGRSVLAFSNGLLRSEAGSASARTGSCARRRSTSPDSRCSGCEAAAGAGHRVQHEPTDKGR